MCWHVLLYIYRLVCVHDLRVLHMSIQACRLLSFYIQYKFIQVNEKFFELKGTYRDCRKSTGNKLG